MSAGCFWHPHIAVSFLSTEIVIFTPSCAHGTCVLCIHPIVTMSLHCCDWVCNTHGVFGCINVMRACLPFPGYSSVEETWRPPFSHNAAVNSYSLCPIPTFPYASSWQLETWFILRNICIFRLTDSVQSANRKPMSQMFLYMHFSSLCMYQFHTIHTL